MMQQEMKSRMWYCYLNYIIKFFTQHKKDKRYTSDHKIVRELMAQSVTTVTRKHTGEVVMYIHKCLQVNK
jgi:hypothetical protein